MKNLIYIFSLLMITSLSAQDKKQVDKMEETETTKTTVNKNGEKVSESTVKVVTKKEQEIKTVQRKGNTPDGDKIETPVKVTQSIEINSDSDPFYNVNDKVVFYNYDNTKFSFTSNKGGFDMITPENNTYAEARKTASTHFYLMRINGEPGVGYFNKDGNFIVEYYDKKNDAMIIQSYEMSK